MTAWTPYPTYSLVYTPSVGAALDELKRRHIPGIDYYQSALHEPPFMSDELVADFNKVYDENLSKLIELYNAEIKPTPQDKYSRLDINSHIFPVRMAAGTHPLILKVETTTHKIRQLVAFEQYVRSRILAKQQEQQAKAERIAAQWTRWREEFHEKPWPEPSDRNIMMYMAVRIQQLEALVLKLLDERRLSTANNVD